MRRAAKTDDNQAEIVAVARKMGLSVALLHTIGDGLPDILLGVDGIDQLVEIKDGNKPPSARKLTPPEEKFHSEWRGRKVAIVKNVDELILLARAMRIDSALMRKALDTNRAV